MPLPEHVVKISGPKPGATVAIFCGVHGNERAGILAVERLTEELVLEAGVVYLVRANPPAIERNVRLVEANLNRLFLRNGPPNGSYEHYRAAELMDLLDGCDALLDLHSYPDPHDPKRAAPFAICEAPSFPIAALFDVPIVVSGFTVAEEGGSDGYMHLNGKPGICVELGAIERSESFADLGVDTARRFLAHVGCISPLQALERAPQRRLEVTTFYKKTRDDFRFVRDFRNFDAVKAGEAIATENGLVLQAECDSCLIFPYGNRPVGIEAFLLAREAA